MVKHWLQNTQSSLIIIQINDNKSLVIRNNFNSNTMFLTNFVKIFLSEDIFFIRFYYHFALQFKDIVATMFKQLIIRVKVTYVTFYVKPWNKILTFFWIKVKTASLPAQRRSYHRDTRPWHRQRCKDKCERNR